MLFYLKTQLNQIFVNKYCIYAIVQKFKFYFGLAGIIKYHNILQQLVNIMLCSYFISFLCSCLVKHDFHLLN